MTKQEIIDKAPKGATHYAIDDKGCIVYLKRYRRTINFCDGFRTDNQLGSIKPL